jgi:hypothetical protein
MPRKSIVELTAQAIASFPDNVTGLITPALLRTMFEDFLKAIAPAYGICQKTAPQTVNLGLTPTAIAYTTAQSSDINQLLASAALGEIERLERGTSTINFTMDIECATNRFITATLFKDGVATPWRITANGAGTGNPVGMALTAIDYADPAATYDVRLSAETAGVSTVINNGAFLLSVDPVNSYT